MVYIFWRQVYNRILHKGLHVQYVLLYMCDIFTWGQYIYCRCAGPLRSDGQLSNFAHIENCSFIRNTAERFGAAIEMVSPVLAFNRFNSESVKPFEIESW